METWTRSLDLRVLAERFGTPLYVLHEPTLRENFRRWAALVGDPGGVRYPVKANPSPTVLRTLAALGSGAVGALQSAYMHELAAQDAYDIREARTGRAVAVIFWSRYTP